METIFNLKNLREELDSQEWEGDEWDQDYEARSVYLGTVFALYPSGKYYMPFACSNVTEEEAEKDEIWREQAEEELGTIGCSLVSGEGDPCDLFATETREKEEILEEDFIPIEQE